jgi:hypothetical protein
MALNIQRSLSYSITPVPSEVLSNSKRTFGKGKLWGNCETPYKCFNGGLKAVEPFFKNFTRTSELWEILAPNRGCNFLIKLICRNLKVNLDVSHQKSCFNVLKLLNLPK